ncbi:helix-turn-helix domain-containing protein [Ligilactobacillus araffinosus]|uniref:Helicase Helix-turn-helix domain-containing protein n=1 Tax=Ligilactobacillus araffinosus DSM 20653 TaxID=1423820 RepID=A0A0R1ZMZ9_9LACO|nr:helix-turn-helix domain-containing protein [Ligilactobacillus araffinosus]KRM52275.1 hypothetical protein FC64_GL000700 [Ligilactobacillus araffinosus DSM 20653]
MADWHLLHFFDQRQPRKATVLRQILTNKRTGSVLFWGLRYHYLDYLNAVPRFDVKKFNDVIDELIAQKWLQSSAQGLQLTSQGQEVIATHRTRYSFVDHPELNQKFDYQLWQAILLLMVQVASEYRYHNSNYYVANQNLKAQFVIKSWLQVNTFEMLAAEISECLTQFLDQCDPAKADLFTAKLVGHTQNGLSDGQIASQLGISPLEVSWTWRDLALQLAAFIQARSNLKIGQLVQITALPGALTPTIHQTAMLFNDGKTVDQIIQIRRLRRSTIEEHLQVLAIFQPDFPYEKVLSESDLKILSRVYAEPDIDQWRYAELQQQGFEMPFLKFRLYAIMKTHGECNE